MQAGQLGLPSAVGGYQKSRNMLWLTGVSKRRFLREIAEIFFLEAAVQVWAPNLMANSTANAAMAEKITFWIG